MEPDRASPGSCGTKELQEGRGFLMNTCICIFRKEETEDRNFSLKRRHTASTFLFSNWPQDCSIHSPDFEISRLNSLLQIVALWAHGVVGHKKAFWAGATQKPSWSSIQDPLAKDPQEICEFCSPSSLITMSVNEVGAPVIQVLNQIHLA